MPTVSFGTPPEASPAVARRAAFRTASKAWILVAGCRVGDCRGSSKSFSMPPVPSWVAVRRRAPPSLAKQPHMPWSYGAHASPKMVGRALASRHSGGAALQLIWTSVVVAEEVGRALVPRHAGGITRLRALLRSPWLRRSCMPGLLRGRRCWYGLRSETGGALLPCHVACRNDPARPDRRAQPEQAPRD